MSDELSLPLDKLTGPDEDFSPDRAEGAGKEKMPQLPDGIGLSYEDIRLLMSMKHQTAMEMDDPVLMMVTVCNSFLGETQNLHQRHNEALSRIIAGKTREYISGVKQSADAFSQTLADASVEGVRRIFEDHAAKLQAHQGNARWCALIVAISALANIAVLALR
ncbi:MAG: hypothetical protein LBP33_09550 [Candidatus Adiutrix sp.]|jgi:hypothetical protein|nr:hypothetical protein [Candidatus Adiutrix sp.]